MCQVRKAIIFHNFLEIVLPMPLFTIKLQLKIQGRVAFNGPNLTFNNNIYVL